ncbi:MAG TPA: TolC family protein, partial [Terriglobales bacterium]
PFAGPSSTASREECVRIALEQSPDVENAKQAVERAKAALEVAKSAYIPDLSGLAPKNETTG